MKLFETANLGTVERGRANNLNLIRLVLASSVVFSHSYPILHQQLREPMMRYLHIMTNLGDCAVFGFFYISGFLITKSAIRHTDPAEFLRARALRIFPGLAVAVLISTFIIGPAFTNLSLSDYFHNSQTYYYLATVVLHHHVTLDLPGLFQSHAIHEVNLPLWTLSSEWTMYLVALFVAVAIRWRSLYPGITPASWIAIGIAAIVTLQMFPLPMHYAYKWMIIFAAGSLSYRFRRHIPLSVPFAVPLFLLDLFLLRFSPHLGTPLFPLTYFYLLLVVGFHPALFAGWYLKVGDPSYGLYIYGWTIGQILSVYFVSPPALFFATYLIALPVALLSWHLIESRSLAFKRRSKQKHLHPHPTASEIPVTPPAEA